MESSMLVTMLLLMPCVAGNTTLTCPSGHICRTKPCVSIADEIFDSLDNSTDPCEDFYEFACGGWIDRHFLDKYKPKETSFVSNLRLAAIRKMLVQVPTPSDLDAVRKAKNFYRSCTHHLLLVAENGSLVHAVTAMFGRWPITCAHCNVTRFDAEIFLRKAIQLGVHPLFTLKAEPHPTIPEQNALYITKPALGLLIHLYESFKNYPPYQKLYENKIYVIARKFGIDNQIQTKQDAAEVVRFESLLAELYMAEHYEDSAETKTLASLELEYGELMNWTSFLSNLGSSPDIGIMDITSDLEVFVTDHRYMLEMIGYFNDLSQRARANYIMWSVIDSLQHILITEDQKLRSVLGLASFDYITEEACALYASDVFHLVVHRLMFDAHFHRDQFETATTLFGHLTDELTYIVDGHTWVNTSTKQVIKEKIRALDIVLLSHEHAMNNSVLESYYANMTIDEYNFIHNEIEARKQEFAWNFRSIGTNTELDPTRLSHKIVGEYFPRFNKILLSSVALQHPYFFHNAPWSLTFAALGTVIGHEIIHAFDTQGHRYSKDGILGEWWDNETVAHLHQRAQCLVDQYSAFYYKTAEEYVNGNLTLDSNIADNGGLKLAYKAYKTYNDLRDRVDNRTEKLLPGMHFSKDQVFFIKFAQMRCTVESKSTAKSAMKKSHSPDEFRIIGPLKNSEAFARAFNCPLGSPMNPANKCEVW